MVEGCIAPGEIKEGDLVAYLEGAASSQVRRHIAGCAVCAAEVESLRQVDSMLTTVFRRANGPVFTEVLTAQPDLLVSSPPLPQPTKVDRMFKLAWPEFGFQKISWARVALVVVSLLVFGGILVAIYDGTGQIWNHAAQTARVTAEATVDLMVRVTDEVVEADTNWDMMNDNQTSTPGQAIVENTAAIAPPRTLLLMLENELHGVVEEPTDIAPPREIVLMLENQLQTQLDDKALIYSKTKKEPYWDETLVMDPEGGYSHLVWIDNTGGYSTIYATQALADGQTLSDPVIINQSLDRAFNPILAVDTGGTLYVVWRTRHHLDMGIYFARSTDVGQTWSKSMRINDEIRQVFNPSLAVDSQGHLYIAWQNRLGVNAGIYLAHSSDGGQTWIEERRVAN